MISIACIPVLGRQPLLPFTIKRLLEKNGCERVICIGDNDKDKHVCLRAGAEWIYHPNKPLGRKWNAGFEAAKYYKPDYVLYVGSSDWLCDDWITLIKPHVDTHQMAGTPGCYFMDIGKTIRLVNWKGYRGERSNETIGIGRVLSAELLDKLNWQPFHPDKDSSLDRSMKDKARMFGIDDFMVHDDNLKAVSLSTPLWDNKHKFDHHWLNVLPSEKIDDVEGFIKMFPEAKELHKVLFG
jgi:glycosyltransferase involved in cell wall biosynthesis